jgi:transposase
MVRECFPYEYDTLSSRHPAPQIFWLPPALTDCIPAAHEVYACSAIVDALDLQPIDQTYASLRGLPPYDPAIMVTILV